MSPTLSQPPVLVITSFVFMIVVLLLVVGAIGLLTHSRTRERELKVVADTRDSMLAKGFSAEEIAKVLDSIRRPNADDLAYEESDPAPCDVVAKADRRDWSRALLLSASIDGNQFLVHHVGTDPDRNEWIPRDRVRFPATFSPEALDANAPPFPFAAPVLAERDEEWVPAYVVTTRKERSYVHFIGADWDENEWLGEPRLRRAAYPESARVKPEPSRELMDV